MDELRGQTREQGVEHGPASSFERALTDYERDGLESQLNLADGHAYQGIESLLPDELGDLNELWRACEEIAVPEMEARFQAAFARLAGSTALAGMPALVCPTASNSIDIVAAVARELRWGVRLVEPTFDNLALILTRRSVRLGCVVEPDLHTAIAEGSITDILAGCDALFIVQPNNPTGASLSQGDFEALVGECVSGGKTLLIDNSFRFHGREPFDDYRVLEESGVSFIAFEDTGKVWPTHDLKASLLVASADLRPLVAEIYNEIFLCHSRFGLALMTRLVDATDRIGLDRTVWSQVDERRVILREALEALPLNVAAEARESTLPVEWLNCATTGMLDVEVTRFFATRGLAVLPGRQFYWRNGHQLERQWNIRIAMMKPLEELERAARLLRRVGAALPQPLGASR